MRLWLDTTTAALMHIEHPNNADKDILQGLIDAGNTIVIANTAVDVAVFQNNIDWLREKLKEKSIIIEIWHTVQEMISKPFYWSSRFKETPASDDFKEAIKALEDYDKIIAVAELLDKFGLNKGEWKCGEYVNPTPISKENADKLGVDVNATRTDILIAARSKGLFDVYDDFNVQYCSNLAHQHYCEGIITSKGRYKVL